MKHPFAVVAVLTPLLLASPAATTQQNPTAPQNTDQPLAAVAGVTPISDLLAAPNRFWNRTVTVKGVVRSVTAYPPGTNRGSYQIRDASDKHLNILTAELPAVGAALFVTGLVYQTSVQQRIPLLVEGARGTDLAALAAIPPPKTAAVAARPALPPPVPGSPAAPRAAMPPPKTAAVAASPAPPPPVPGSPSRSPPNGGAADTAGGCSCFRRRSRAASGGDAAAEDRGGGGTARPATPCPGAARRSPRAEAPPTTPPEAAAAMVSPPAAVAKAAPEGTPPPAGVTKAGEAVTPPPAPAVVKAAQEPQPAVADLDAAAAPKAAPQAAQAGNQPATIQLADAREDGVRVLAGTAGDEGVDYRSGRQEAGKRLAPLPVDGGLLRAAWSRERPEGAVPRNRSPRAGRVLHRPSRNAVRAERHGEEP